MTTAWQWFVGGGAVLAFLNARDNPRARFRRLGTFNYPLREIGTMKKEKFVIRFTNGFDSRHTVTEQPDAIFAAMYGQKLAPDVFGQRWNTVPDERKWKIVVLLDGAKLREDSVVLRLSVH